MATEEILSKFKDEIISTIKENNDNSANKYFYGIIALYLTFVALKSSLNSYFKYNLDKERISKGLDINEKSSSTDEDESENE